jgi:hypothetical protein
MQESGSLRDICGRMERSQVRTRRSSGDLTGDVTESADIIWSDEFA